MLVDKLQKVGSRTGQHPPTGDVKDLALETGPSVTSIRKTLELESNLFASDQPKPDLSLQLPSEIEQQKEQR